MKSKARAALACEIAGIDRQRFAEAIASANFPCAPPTARGSARVFDVDDIVVVCIYARLLNLGLQPHRAGTYACQAFNSPQFRDGDEVVTVAVPIDGLRAYPGGPPFVNDEQADQLCAITINYHIESLRKYVVEKLEESAAILGSDE